MRVVKTCKFGLLAWPFCKNMGELKSAKASSIWCSLFVFVLWALLQTMSSDFTPLTCTITLSMAKLLGAGACTKHARGLHRNEEWERGVGIGKQMIRAPFGLWAPMSQSRSPDWLRQNYTSVVRPWHCNSRSVTPIRAQPRLVAKHVLFF